MKTSRHQVENEVENDPLAPGLLVADLGANL